MTTYDPNDLLSSSPSGSKGRFENVGDKHSGEILALEARPKTKFGTDEPEFTKSGKQKMLLIVTLQTDERDPGDPDDTGIRTLWLGGWDFLPKTGIGAVAKAVHEAGAKRLEIGGTLAVAYTGDGEPPQPGYHPPKEFAAAYKPPVAGVDLGALLPD